MKKGKTLLIILMLGMLSLIYFEITHVFGSAKAYNVSLPDRDKDINAGIDNIGVRKIKFKELLNINGWAYINDIDATQQKVYITLVSSESQYIFDTEKVLRADLPDALNDKQNKIENAGLETLIDMSMVEKGSYRIGFYIENGSEKKLNLSSMSVNVENKKVEILEIMNNRTDLKLVQSTNEVKANIEEVRNGEGYVKIKGWAFLKGVSHESSEIYIVLKDQKNNQLTFFDSDSQIRKDVTAYFGEGGT